MAERTDLQAVIDALEVEYKALGTTLVFLRAKAGLIPLVDGATGENPPKAPDARTEQQGELRPDSFFGMGIAPAVKKYLAMEKRPKPLPTIVAALKSGGILTQSTDFYNTVYNTMLRDYDDFVKLGSGEWGLAEWYPSRPKTSEKQKRQKRKANNTEGKLTK